MGRLQDDERDWYQQGVRLLRNAGVPFLVGGAYAMLSYTGVRRPTKDLDLFLRPRDLPLALAVLKGAGSRTQVTAGHWLGKATYKGYLIDFILGMANGVGQVDDSWFDHAKVRRVIGYRLPVVGPEDMIWSKAFVQERDRYDGADIAHLLLHHGKALRWPLLLGRFRGHEPVLLSHLVLFRYIYPHAKEHIPRRVWKDLIAATERSDRGLKLPPRLCRGTYFSRTQYVADVLAGNYQDARLLPYGPLTDKQILD